MLIFPHFRAIKGGYPTSDILAIHTRASAKWQDTTATAPAVSAGDPVKRIDDISGNGKHWVWASGTVPTLAADGSVVFAGGCLTASSLVPGSTFSIYAWQDATATTSVSVCDPAAEGNRYIQPRYSPGTNAYFQSGVGSVVLADPASLEVRGLVQTGSSSTAFVGSNEGTFATAASWTGLRIAAGGSSWSGTHRALVLCSGAHSPSERDAWRALVATL